MKQVTLSILSTTVLVALLSTQSVLAKGHRHHGKGPGCGGKGMQHVLELVPDLTDDQKTKLKEMKTEFMQSMIPVRKEGRTLHGELHELISSNGDENAINTKIDEIAAHHAKAMKMRVRHLQNARSQLTEEQVEFIKEYGPGILHGCGGCCMGMGKGKGKGTCPHSKGK